VQNRILMFKQGRVFGALALLLKMKDFILEFKSIDKVLLKVPSGT
jgi:hypothetical protein